MQHAFQQLVPGSQVSVKFRDGAYGVPRQEPFPATYGGYAFPEDEETGLPMEDEMYLTFTDPAIGPALYPVVSYAETAGRPLTAPWYDIEFIEADGIVYLAQ